MRLERDSPQRAGMSAVVRRLVVEPWCKVRGHLLGKSVGAPGAPGAGVEAAEVISSSWAGRGGSHQVKGAATKPNQAKLRAELELSVVPEQAA